VLEWLINFGLAGIVLLLLATGVLVPGHIYRDQKSAYEKTTDALAVERQRNADLQQMAITGAKALDAIAQVAEEQRVLRAREEAAAMKRAVVPGGTFEGGP